MAINPIICRRLRTQGFVGLDDATLQGLAPWLRWSPALCTLFMLAGAALRSPTILWALAGTALLGTILPFHPFDLLYNYGVRYLSATPKLPHQGPPRRFACGIATLWLLATGWAFHAGFDLVGYALAIPLVLVAALVSVTHICIPSMIYGALFSVRGRRSAAT